MTNSEQTFTKRAATFAEQQAQVARKQYLISWFRLSIFVLGAGAAGYLFYTGQTGYGFAVLGVFYVVFALVIKWHSRVAYRARHLGFLKQLNEEELARLNANWATFDGGERYQNPLHPYTSDLDIFGPQSVYKLLNRATTQIGKDKLAGWLQKLPSPDEVQLRQQASKELSELVDWRQNFQALGMHQTQRPANTGAFFSWLHEPYFFTSRNWLKIALALLPPLTLAALAYWILGNSSYPFLALTLAQYLLSVKYSTERDEAYEKSEGMHDILRTYTALAAHIETAQWQAPKLTGLQGQMQSGNTKASELFNQLATRTEYFSARLNTFIGFLLNSLLLWDFFWMWRIESWKKQAQHNLNPILDSLAETEALASLAALQFANPEFAVPEISAAQFHFQATELGHPLIPKQKRVSNSFTLENEGSTAVITGSNMSGKSTFLRTMGVNLVLANTGAVVCAKQLHFHPIQVFTSMRTQDDLAESTSSFYAELKRLQQLLQLTEQQVPVLYLLDEILKGTNSHDRHMGARALIKQLHKRPAFGLISTHDLELGALEKELPGSVQNYSFNSEVTDGKLLFDYRLQQGVCRSFNAALLMQMIGIEMEETNG